MELVPTRRCGECTLCCKVLRVDTPELKKMSGVWCPDCREGAGCAIYETRPPICRIWYCGWRLRTDLPEDWRPDRSGVLVDTLAESDIQEGEVPAPYRQQAGIKFLVLAGDAIERPGFAEVVGGFVFSGIPSFLALCGPPGYQQAKVFLNEAMKPAVMARDREAAMAVLRQAMQLLARHQFELSPAFSA